MVSRYIPAFLQSLDPHTFTCTHIHTRGFTDKHTHPWVYGQIYTRVGTAGMQTNTHTHGYTDTHIHGNIIEEKNALQVLNLNKSVLRKTCSIAV